MTAPAIDIDELERRYAALKAIRFGEVYKIESAAFGRVLVLAFPELFRLARLAATQADEIAAYRRAYGCLSCGENHPPGVMCPPHEMRTTGRAWYDVKLREAVAEIAALKAQADALTALSEAAYEAHMNTVNDLHAQIAALRKCSVCGQATELACSDCRIDFQMTIFVCANPTFRDEHERKCSANLRTEIAALRAERDEAKAKNTRLEHIANRTQRSRRYSSEQWARAAREALAGDARNLRNRVEMHDLPAPRHEDQCDGSALLILDGEKIASIDAAIASARALLVRAGEAAGPFLEWAKHDLVTADELQLDFMSYEDDCEADVRDFDGNSTRPLLWGDFRRLREVAAAIDRRIAELSSQEAGT